MDVVSNAKLPPHENALVFYLFALPDFSISISMLLMFWIFIKCMYKSFQHHYTHHTECSLKNYNYYYITAFGVYALYLIAVTASFASTDPQVVMGELFNEGLYLVVSTFGLAIFFTFRYCIFLNKLLSNPKSYNRLFLVVISWIVLKLAEFLFAMLVYKLDGSKNYSVFVILDISSNEIVGSILNYICTFVKYFLFYVYPIYLVLDQSSLDAFSLNAQKNTTRFTNYTVDDLLDNARDSMDGLSDLNGSVGGNYSITVKNELEDIYKFEPFNSNEIIEESGRGSYYNNLLFNSINSNKTNSEKNIDKNLLNLKIHNNFGELFVLVYKEEKLFLRDLQIDIVGLNMEKYKKDLYNIKQWSSLLHLNSVVVPKYIVKKLDKIQIVYEYFQMKSLWTYCRSKTVREKLMVVKALFNTVHRINKRKLYLSNLTLDNIWVDSIGQFHITGVGFSELKAYYCLSADYMEAFKYLAPEIMLRDRDCVEFPNTKDSKCDIYSLGIIVYELFLGEKVFLDMKKTEYLDALVNKKFGIKISNLKISDREIHEYTLNLIKACTEVNVEERPTMVHCLYIIEDLIMKSN